MTRAAIVLSIALAVSACGSDKRGDVVPADEAAKLLEDRNWIDHWPENAQEQLYVYRFTPQMGGGVFQDRTLFAGHFELFTYELGSRRIEIRWPHTRSRSSLEYEIRRVDGPKPFDLRLDLEGSPRGPAVYYGRSAESHADPLIPHLQ